MTVDPLKIVFVGDHECGKTSLILTFKDNGQFPQDSVLTTAYIEGNQMTVRVDGVPNSIYPCDTGGEEKYDHLRPLNYPDTSVFVICFSLDSPQSLEDVKTRWLPEIQAECRCRPIILLGCKKDLRDEKETAGEGEFVPTILAESVQKQIGAAQYMECSAKTYEGVLQFFHSATKLAAESQTIECKCKHIDSSAPKKKFRCCCTVCWA